jgi:hypothetical protein
VAATAGNSRCVRSRTSSATMSRCSSPMPLTTMRSCS